MAEIFDTPLRILVVEDYHALRTSIVGVLQSDGHTAWGLANAEDIDDDPFGFVPELYIIDLNLPGEDGFSLTQRIRNSQPDAHIILLTARTAVEDRINGYSVGANNYLPKPLVIDELRAIIGGVIAKRHLAHKAASKQDAHINAKTLMFKGPHGDFRLSADELLLLSAFCRAHNQTLEHWQVEQHFNASGELSKKYLEVKLGRLRRKLIDTGVSRPAIKVIRNFGYQMQFQVQIAS